MYQKLEKALKEGRNLSESYKRKLFNLIDLNNKSGKLNMQLVLQYSEGYATHLTNDTRDIVLQVTPKLDSPPLRARRCENSSQSSSATATSTDENYSERSTSTLTAPPVARKKPAPTTSNGTHIRAERGEAGPSSHGPSSTGPPPMVPQRQTIQGGPSHSILRDLLPFRWQMTVTTSLRLGRT